MKKTMLELAKEFPDKTYRELEKYRDADRLEEAAGIGHSNPPNEGEEQDNPTLWEIAKEHDVSYADAVPIQEDMRLKRDALKAACTLAEMRKDRTPLELMKKRAEEAEGELSIMKGIETNRVKEAQARCDHLQNELDRVKKENNDLFNRVAESLEINESHQKYNGKLQERLTELEQENIELHADNKKMHMRLDKEVENMRKSGL
jgi:DNA polymerase III alpha subunit (gram-positive type)